MMRRTKIVATIGPATNSYEKIRGLVLAGVNVARLNFSHGSHEDHLKVIENVKKVRKELGLPVAILLDTKGPEMRVGEIEPLVVKKGDLVRLVKKFEKEGDIPIVPPFVVDQFQGDVEVLFDDGYVSGIVRKRGTGFVEVEIHNDGVIKKQKSVGVPNQQFDLPDVTEQDMLDLRLGCRAGVEIIAASFINHAKQVLAIKEILAQEGKPEIMVIAKIETKLGVENFDEILEIADGIMVARGDLGVQLFVGHVPPLQKKMIRACNLKSKVVITATQMLESMIQNPTPTRAEASDVANAIYDATSAVMLSGETAVGKHPLQAVRIMHEIICEAEKDFEYEQYFQNTKSSELQNVPTAMARAAVNISYGIDAKAIVVCSNSGLTVKRLARFHPKAWIIAVTPSEITFHQTAIIWGTVAFRETNVEIEKSFEDVACFALKRGFVKYGDFVVITSGKPYGVSFTTNAITVQSIGGVLVRGSALHLGDNQPSIKGEIKLLFDHPERALSQIEGKVVVMTRIKKEELFFLTKVKCVILQNHPLDKFSKDNLRELYKEYLIPYITDADGATFLLKEGEIVRISPSKGLVFKGDAPTEEEMRKNF
jgi:pyruvate kinase